jgi:hypothetical protein
MIFGFLNEILCKNKLIVSYFVICHLPIGRCIFRKALQKTPQKFLFNFHDPKKSKINVDLNIDCSNKSLPQDQLDPQFFSLSNYKRENIYECFHKCKLYIEHKLKFYETQTKVFLDSNKVAQQRFLVFIQCFAMWKF